MSNTISNELLDEVIKVFAIEAVVWYWTELVLLIKPLALVTNVGREPVPFSMMSNTILNPLPTLVCCVSAGVIDDVIWTPPNMFTPLWVFVTIVGIEPVPLLMILITLPNDDDTIKVSVFVADAELNVWVVPVTTIPLWVFSTNWIELTPTLPLRITLSTLSNVSSNALLSTAISLVNSLA